MRTRALLGATAALAVTAAGCSGTASRQTGGEPGGSSPSAAAPSPANESDGPCFGEGEDFGGEARLYIEHNATDEDTGFHGTIDQEGLARGCITMPGGSTILLLEPAGQLGELGLNQFFFESREPPNDEYSIADLKRDFPEGDYRISGFDHEGTPVVDSALFTHAIPAPPQVTAPRLVTEEEAASSTVDADRLVVRWQPVTETVDGGPVTISAYEVIVTKVKHADPHGRSRPEYDVHVPPGTTDLAVPAGFLERQTVYEVEVLALEESGNQTITVGFFTTS